MVCIAAPLDEERSTQSKLQIALALHDWLNAEAPLLRQANLIENVMHEGERVVRAELPKIAGKLNGAQKTVDEADDRTIAAIAVAYAETFPPGNRDVAGRRQYLRDIWGLKRLRDALAAAQTRASRPIRSSLLGAIRPAARLLAQKFEEISGETFTFDHIPATHGPASWSRGADFAAIGVRGIFPDATDANLVTVMREIPNKRRNLQKGVGKSSD